jgi:hypothetical protein
LVETDGNNDRLEDLFQRRGTMNKQLCGLLVAGAVVSYSQASLAEEYGDCRSRCTNDYTDCMNQPQSSEPEIVAAREAACTQKVQLCFSDCENLRRPNDNGSPQPDINSNPNIIIK